MSNYEKYYKTIFLQILNQYKELDNNSDHLILGLLENEQQDYVNKIKKALTRIEDRTFGICEKCSSQIENKILFKRPTATRCFSCS